MENKIKFTIQEKSLQIERAISLVKKIKEHGFEAYFAGGAVRDLLLGLPVHDIDIATSARPKEIKNIFANSYDKGKDFGVVGIKSKVAPTNGEEFEITTFRSDIGTLDHRRPKKVEFSSAQEDALRRDFTINGLFFDPQSEEVIDFVDGLKDLKRKIVRFIGNPGERIEEDYLRILRAVRFCEKLGFHLEEETKKAIKQNALKIKEISAERIRDELNKILILPNRDTAIKELDNLGLLKEILPELKKTQNVPQPREFHSEGDVFTHILLALKNAQEAREELIWAILLHDIAKPQTIGFRSKIGKTSITFFDHDKISCEMAEDILRRLCFSHHFIHSVTWAISQHMRIINAFRGMSERKQKKLFSDQNIELLLDLTKADLSASLRANSKPDMEMYEEAVKLKEKFQKEMSEEEKHQVKKFDLISGRDIMEILKLSPGPEVGKIKTDIEKTYLDGKINSRAEAIKILEKYRSPNLR